MDVGLAISIVALVIAIGFGIWQAVHNRKIDQELLSGGTTLLEVGWSWLNKPGAVRCEAQAKEVALSEVAIRSKRGKKLFGDLPKGERRALEFSNVSKGEKWTVTFKDSNKKLHRQSCLVWGNGTELLG